MILITEEYFNQLSDQLFAKLHSSEYLTLNLVAEDSQFIRLNRSKVRQIGSVGSAFLQINLKATNEKSENRQIDAAYTLTGNYATDLECTVRILKELQSDLSKVPVDPYLEIPKNYGSSSKTTKGKLLSKEEAVEAITSPITKLDLAGIYASGTMIRANSNSLGQRHWFSTDNFSLDFSLYTANEKAIKETFAGNSWSQDKYKSLVAQSAEKLVVLENPGKKLERGSYRVYLAPSSVHDLIAMLSWGGISELAIRQGDSPLRHMRSQEKTLSPLFSLSEDFRSGDVPQFNSLGELAPPQLALIEKGKLQNTLVSARTAKEYKIPANAASSGEGLRSPVVATGSLSEENILATLGTGLYLSNLHYLNWSDQQGGRITGMTRYACFWVENGKIQSPIENLRFDDSIFHLFGSELEAVTNFQSLIPETTTYEYRHLGAVKVPGMVIKNMAFTL